MNPADLLPSGKPRRPLRPLHGIPDRDPRGRTGLVLSALFHGAIIVLLLLPPVIATSVLYDETTGGGGPGPAGGGGGGTGGTGGETVKPEKLRFLQVAPIPKVSPASITPPVVPPPKPPEVKEPEPTPTPPTPAPQPVTAAPSGPTIPTPGAGGGSGHDGTGGNGPGTGGGVGSGTGTGRGSGNGPGTGGGPGPNFRPQVQMTPILPQPIPNKVRPYKLVAVFEVDERGNAQLIAFNPSRDSGYNRKLREMLAELRFRPATRPDGTPVRDTATVSWEAPH